jgi:hypothetical protein
VTRWGVLAAVFGVLVLVVGVLALELKDTRAELVAAEARAAAFEEAARIHRRHVVQLEAAKAEAGALDRELQEGEGADAALSDYLVRGAGRVWP